MNPIRIRTKVGSGDVLTLWFWITRQWVTMAHLGGKSICTLDAQNLQDAVTNHFDACMRMKKAAQTFPSSHASETNDDADRWNETAPEICDTCHGTKMVDVDDGNPSLGIMPCPDCD